MKKPLLAILLTLCLGLAACGGGSTSTSENAGAQSQSAEAENAEAPDAAEAEGTESPDAAESTAADENSEAETAPAEVKEPTIVEITMDNWDQYFEIIPVHAAYPYVRQGESDQFIINCNAFEFALKDEYAQNYFDHSGYFISDKVLNWTQTYWLYEEGELIKLSKDGDVNFPQGADITVTVAFTYDGDTLGADVNNDLNPDFTYTAEYYSTEGPIEFERTATIGNREYRYPAYYNSLKKSNIPEPSDNAFDFTSTEVQTIDSDKVRYPRNYEIFFQLTKDKVSTHLVSVASVRSGMDRSEAGMELENSGEILDHFTVTVKDISGTLPVWE